MNDKEFIDKLTKASQHIHNSSIRGSANYIITSSFVADKWKDFFVIQEIESKVIDMLKNGKRNSN